MNSRMRRQREIWVDVIRAAATFMVVWLHSAAPWIYNYGKVPDLCWQFANITDSAVRMSIPLFFMLTGYLFLGREVFLREYFIKRGTRIVVPWLAWSVLYVLWHRFYDGAEISFLSAMRSFVNGSVSGHLWFFYALTGLYLFVPIMAWLMDSHDRSKAYYFIALWLAGASLMPFSNRVLTYVTGREIKAAFDLTMFGGYSGYLVIGSLVGRINLTRATRWIAAGFVTAGVALTILGTSIITSKSGVFIGYFYEYVSPNVIMTSVGAFVLLKQLGHLISNNAILSSICEKVSGASLGIYLVHPMFLDLIRGGSFGANLASLSNSTSFSIPLVALLAFTFSCGVAHTILQVPFIRRIV
jgi:surface polysaccharide O-acyltransferase-like enzyme